MKDMEIKIEFKDGALSLTGAAREAVQNSDVLMLQIMGLAGTMESVLREIPKKERERGAKEGVEVVSKILMELLTTSNPVVFAGKEAAFMAELMRKKREGGA